MRGVRPNGRVIHTIRANKMETPAKMSSIVEVASRSLHGEVINDRDVKWALQAVNSVVALDKYAALVVLLLSRAPEFSVAAAFEKLERECKNTPAELESFWLNWAVNCLPPEKLVASESIRLFIYRSAFSEQIACRSNTMGILERLARCGDSTSLTILNICASSSEPKVRTNARSSIKAIESDSDIRTDQSK